MGIRAIQENERHYQDQPGEAEEIRIREGGTVTLQELIPFSADSNGNESCFVAASDTEEYQCVYFAGPLVAEDRRAYAPLDSYVVWSNVVVESGGNDEVIRLVYEDDDAVLLDELHLG